MKSSTRNYLGGLLVIVGCIAVYGVLRFSVVRLTASSDTADFLNSGDERETVKRYEDRRAGEWAVQAARRDSLRKAWDAEREERRLAREVRERAYADSQRVWAARKQERAEARERRQAYYDSIRALRPQKLAKGATVDVNVADLEELQRIPGVGPVSAGKIVDYRNALGGFVSVHQLGDIEGLPYDIGRWVRVERGSAGIRRIRLNRDDFKTINRHPYISYEQTKVIVNLRSRIGRIRGFDDLRGSGAFSDADYERLEPYVTF